MAMSKKCFVFALCVIVAIIVGAVVFVVIQTQGHGGEKKDKENNEDEDAVLMEQDDSILDPKKAEMMCEMIINGTEPSPGAYNHRSMFHALLGKSTISLRVLTSSTSDTYQKNSFWLTGDQFTDKKAISTIRTEACLGKIPVIVISMRPSKGIKLSRNIQMWNHYKPAPLFETWEEYDKKLNAYLRQLAPIPSIIILEPDLLMLTYDTHNLQYDWLNGKYKEEFFLRAQRVIKVMARSWVYVDAGNAAYLKVRENMENMAKSLLRLDGLRGFSINTAHFFNTSYNNMIARRLHCLTGLHYVTDTSRNGGPFSRQSISGIESCYFDPPKILRGLPPGWSWGTKTIPRQKRWAPIVPQQPQNYHQAHPPSQPPSRPQPQYSETIQMPPNSSPPNAQQDPEAYNQWVNSMKNNNAHNHNSGIGNMFQPGSVPQPQPNNYHPSNPANHNMPNGGAGGNNFYNDLSTPSGRVQINAVTAAPTRAPRREVRLRTKEEALAIFRMKTMRRGQCLKREAVESHDANAWIKTPGESDGRLYEYGTYHKCLLGHSKPCDERCRLLTHAEQRSSSCSCEETNTNIDQNPGQPTPQSNNGGVFFAGDHNPNPSPRNTPRRRQNNNQQSNNQNLLQSGNSGQPGVLPSHTSLTDLLRNGR